MIFLDVRTMGRVPALKNGEVSAVAGAVEFELESGGKLFVQPAAVDAEMGGLGLASPNVRDGVKKASQTLDDAIGQITPALEVVAGKLKALSPDAVTVEFGLTLTAETGVMVAKGSAEVHFTVTLAWSNENDGDRVGAARHMGSTGDSGG